MAFQVVRKSPPPHVETACRSYSPSAVQRAGRELYRHPFARGEPGARPEYPPTSRFPRTLSRSTTLRAPQGVPDRSPNWRPGPPPQLRRAGPAVAFSAEYIERERHPQRYQPQTEAELRILAQIEQKIDELAPGLAALASLPGLPTSQIEEFAALPTQVLTAEGAKHTARFYCIFMLCLCVNFTAALSIMYPYVDRVFILGLSSQLQAHVLFHRDIVTLRKSKNRSKSVRIGHTYKKHLSCAIVNNAHKSTFILISSRHGVLTLIWLHTLQYTCVIISNSHLLLLYINPSMWVITLLRFIWSVLQ